MSEPPVEAALDEEPVVREFQAVLREILTHVTPLVRSLPAFDMESVHPDITALPNRVRAELSGSGRPRPREIANVVLRATQHLLTLVNRMPGDLAGDSPRAGAMDELLEHLAAAWVALYFLGIPFIHPWEAVVRHADRNGFVRGAGVCKASGDIYRKARQEWRRNGHCTAGMRQPVVVLDHNPLAFGRLLDAADKGPRFIYALGACYEMLQHRLYVREGGPIKHVLPAPSIDELLRAEAQPADDVLTSLWDLIDLVYGQPRRHFLEAQANVEAASQQVVIVDIQQDDPLAAMPSCVLGPSAGVFRSRVKALAQAAAEASFGTNGNFLVPRQLLEFRKVLLDQRHSGRAIHTEEQFRRFRETFVKGEG